MPANRQKPSTKPTKKKPTKKKSTRKPKPKATPDTPLIQLARRKQKNIAWLWHNRLPLGKVSLLVGDPDSGKSFLSLDLAARISRGLGVPPEPALAKPAGVLLLCADDDVDDTILPRLEAAEADLNRIAFLPSFIKSSHGRQDRLLSLARDIDRIENAIDQTPDCRLIIIDPVSAYLRGVNSNSHVSVRQLLQKLARLAAKRKAAILLVSHPRKQAATTAIYRPIGSLAFAAVARVVLMIANDPAVAGRRLLLPVKMTLHAAPTGRAFRIDEGRVTWEPEPVPFTADEAAVLSVTGDPTSDPRRDAKAWMIDQLRKNRVPAEEVHQRARAAHIPIRLLWLAKKDAKVQSVFDGKQKRWYWKMPDLWVPDPVHSLIEYI